MELTLEPVDVVILVVYLVVIIGTGWLLSKRASKDLDAYFLGGKSLPWWIIGTSHGASGFDVTGTMLFVAVLYTYGLKAAWIPMTWPLFDRIFRQVYLGPWIRRSNVLTGAEWMQTRFGRDLGGNLSQISVVVYCLVATVGFLAYAFQGIGKFADVIFPWNMAWGPFSSVDGYAIAILVVTTIYLLFGGWYSVVLTDVLQFILLAIASVFIAGVAMTEVNATTLNQYIPDGWRSMWFGFGKVDLDWSGLIPALNNKIVDDHLSLFGIFVMIMMFKGLLIGMAGPTPGYSIQNVLSTRNPREAALENWWMSIVQLIPRFLMITGIAVLGLVLFSPEKSPELAIGASFDFEKILPIVIGNYVPAGLVGIVLAGLLAAFMSTFDSTVNSGAAYLANDIYKRYIHRDASQKTYVRVSYLCVVLLVALAIVFGMRVKSIWDITKWITFALYGGYVAPNTLKWYWWRFNGYGYFAGMIVGVIVAILYVVLPDLVKLAFGVEWQRFDKTWSFFITFPISAIASVVVSLMTPPDSEKVLGDFYRNVRPWGFWKPVREKLLAQYPNLKANRDFGMDALNVFIGIVWQMTLMVIPIALVIREWPTMWGAIVVLVVTSVIMKFTWWDRLGPGDMYCTDED